MHGASTFWMMTQSRSKRRLKWRPKQCIFVIQSYLSSNQICPVLGKRTYFFSGQKVPTRVETLINSNILELMLNICKSRINDTSSRPVTMVNPGSSPTWVYSCVRNLDLPLLETGFTIATKSQTLQQSDVVFVQWINMWQPLSSQNRKRGTVPKRLGRQPRRRKHCWNRWFQSFGQPVDQDSVAIRLHIYNKSTESESS